MSYVCVCVCTCVCMMGRAHAVCVCTCACMMGRVHAVCVCACACTMGRAHATSRTGGQRTVYGAAPLLPPLRKFQDLNSDHQTCVTRTFAH
jgi:hypothetical protein